MGKKDFGSQSLNKENNSMKLIWKDEMKKCLQLSFLI